MESGSQVFIEICGRLWYWMMLVDSLCRTNVVTRPSVPVDFFANIVRKMVSQLGICFFFLLQNLNVHLCSYKSVKLPWHVGICEAHPQSKTAGIMREIYFSGLLHLSIYSNTARF